MDMKNGILTKIGMGVTALALAGLMTGCGGGGGGGTTTTDTTTPTPEPTLDVAPVIILNGAEDVTVETGYLYTELGATATDDEDGTLDVVIEGSVDTQTPNTYIIKYSVTDSGNNYVEKLRYVTVSDTTDANKTIVSLLAVYSQGSIDMYGDGVLARIQHVVALANEVNKASQVNLKYELAHVQQYDINDTDSSYDVLMAVTADTNLSTLRDTHGADQVITFKTTSNDGYCGMAWQNGDAQKDYGFSNVSIDCYDSATAHELGHNMGLAHAKIQGETPPVRSYAYGWGEDSEFITIMSYWNYFASTAYPKEALVYSNPNLDCYGFACGVDIGLPDEAYGAQAIRELMDTVAGYTVP